MIKVAVIAALAISLTAADAPRQTVWNAWKEDLARTCPAQHVDLMGDGGYIEFIEAFEATLSHADEAQVVRAADTRRKCASEKLGFGCEMSRTLYAARRLKLLHRMTLFGCRAVKCEEGAFCSRFPRRK